MQTQANKTGMPLAPFMKDGAEAQPLYELTSAATKQALSDFAQVHIGRTNHKNMLIIRVCGVVLAALGVFNLVTGGDVGFMIFELVCGAFFVALSFLMGRLTAAAFMKQWDGPTEARYRFFEEGFEVYQDRGFERRPYSDVTELVANKGSLYLYMGKMRAYVLTPESMGDRAEEIRTFFARVTGRTVALLGGR